LICAGQEHVVSQARIPLYIDPGTNCMLASLLPQTYFSNCMFFHIHPPMQLLRETGANMKELPYRKLSHKMGRRLFNRAAFSATTSPPSSKWPSNTPNTYRALFKIGTATILS
jgi:hypothetical protein